MKSEVLLQWTDYNVVDMVKYYALCCLMYDRCPYTWMCTYASEHTHMYIYNAQYISIDVRYLIIPLTSVNSIIPKKKIAVHKKICEKLPWNQHHCVHHPTLPSSKSDSMSWALLSLELAYLAMLFIIQLLCTTRCPSQLKIDDMHT